MIPSSLKPPVNNGNGDDGSIQVPDLPVLTPTPATTTCPPPTPKATKTSTAAPSPTTTRPAPARAAAPDRSSRETAEAPATSAPPTVPGTPAGRPAEATSAVAAPTPVSEVTATAVHPAIVIGLVLVWIVALIRIGCSWRGRVKRRREEAALQQYATAAVLRAQGHRHLRSVD